jgi:hypothetical protein
LVGKKLSGPGKHAVDNTSNGARHGLLLHLLGGPWALANLDEKADRIPLTVEVETP